MAVRRLLALTALSLLAMSNSCKKEEDTTLCKTSLEVAASQVPGLPGNILEPVPSVGQSNQYLINSAADYREVFTGKLPAVDFTAYTLLAGKTRTARSSRVAAQRVSETCAGYTYTVQLATDTCRTASKAVSNVVYCVLVPKIPLEAKVTFDVQLPPALPPNALSQLPAAEAR